MATTKHVETAVDSQGKSREVEVFVFHNPRKRKVDEKNERKMKPQSQHPQQPVKAPSLKKLTSEVTLDLETARKEVRNFGISCMVGRSKIEAQLAQLKSLGAEIPKHWERKMEKKRRHEEFQRRKQDLKAGIKTKKASDYNKSVRRPEADKKKKKKEKEDVFFDGKIGKYKDGVQFISAADIKRVRNSAKKGNL